MTLSTRRLTAPLTGILLGLSACTPAQLLNATIPTGRLLITRNVAYGDLPRQTLDIYRPREAAASLPTVIFFYGGSWRTGTKAIYPFVAATLARAGMVVVVPDYRLYPDVKYPDFLRDCAQAVAWVQHHPTASGTGPLILMGHSAGAYNAMMLALDPAWLLQAKGDPARIAGVIGMAGPYDFLPITDAEVKPVFPDAGPDTQPITYAGPNAPSALLLAGTGDHQVRPRNSHALAGALSKRGGRVKAIFYPGLGHIGLITALAPAFQWRAPVLRDIVTFVRSLRAA